METNTRQVKVFQVPHIRYTKSGSKRLEDPRDIYEMVANQGARRLRACILGVIPGDVIEAAVKQCEVTMSAKLEITPEFVETMLSRFAEYGVTKEQIEKRIQRRIDALTPGLAVQLKKIYNSLKDGMSSPGDWFDPSAVPEGAPPEPTTGAAALKAAATKGAAKKKDAPAEAGAAGGAPAVSFEQLTAKFEKSTDRAVLDADAELIALLPTKEQQDQAREIYNQRLEELGL